MNIYQRGNWRSGRFWDPISSFWQIGNDPSIPNLPLESTAPAPAEGYGVGTASTAGAAQGYAAHYGHGVGTAATSGAGEGEAPVAAAEGSGVGVAISGGAGVGYHVASGYGVGVAVTGGYGQAWMTVQEQPESIGGAVYTLDDEAAEIHEMLIVLTALQAIQPGARYAIR